MRNRKTDAVSEAIDALECQYLSGADEDTQGVRSLIRRARRQHSRLTKAGRAVVQNWEHGDMASAVRTLAAELQP